MERPIVLWIEDDVDLFTGLEAYLLDMGVNVLKGVSYDEAKEFLAKYDVSLLLFDLMLMRDGKHASLVRRSGMEVGRYALKLGVRYLIIYTIVLMDDCIENLNALTKIADNIEDNDSQPKILYFHKSAAVTEVAGSIKALLGL